MVKTNNFMRCLFCVCILGGFLFSTHIAYGNDFEDNPENVVLSYFNALKNGDIETIITLLTDPILTSKKELFELDPTYSDFLRDYYQNATELTTATTITDESNICLITATIFFRGDENPMTFQFLLKNTEEGWKIAEEKSLP